jgi:hypothetical protein
MTKRQLLQKIESELENLGIIAQENPAVEKCCRAWKLSVCDSRLRNKPQAELRTRGRRAYRMAMPALAGEANVRDFVACVTFGMLLEVLEPEEVSKLLYAAQVATSACRTKNNFKNTPPNATLPAAEPPTIDASASPVPQIPGNSTP